MVENEIDSEITVPSPFTALCMLHSARRYCFREMMDGYWEAWDTLFEAAYQIWDEHCYGHSNSKGIY